MAFIFMDESGDLGFDFSKKGTSQYFLITFLFSNNKRDIEKCVKKVHASLRKRYKRVGVLHAYKDEEYYRIIKGRIVEEKPLFPINNKAPFANYEAHCGTPRTRTYLSIL